MNNDHYDSELDVFTTEIDVDIDSILSKSRLKLDQECGVEERKRNSLTVYTKNILDLLKSLFGK